MNRISGGQFAALLLIVDAFTLFCLKGGISVITAAAFLTGTALQLAMVLPAVKYFSSGGSLRHCPKACLWIYLIYILLWGGLLFVMLWNASEELSVPSENIPFIPEKLLISGLIAITCLYASSPGARSLSRAAVIAAALGAVCIAIVVLAAIPGFRMKYLTDTSAAPGFFEELSRGFVLSGGAGSLIVFLGYTKKSPMKCTLGYFTGKAVLYTVVPVTAAAAAGGIMDITDFPVIAAAEIAQPFSSQRVDSLFLIIFVILAVFAIAVQTAAASYLISELFPGFRRFRSTAALAVMTGSAFILSAIEQYSVIYSAAVVLVLFAVPLIMLKRKNSGRGR